MRSYKVLLNSLFFRPIAGGLGVALLHNHIVSHVAVEKTSLRSTNWLVHILIMAYCIIPILLGSFLDPDICFMTHIFEGFSVAHVISTFETCLKMKDPYNMLTIIIRTTKAVMLEISQADTSCLFDIGEEHVKISTKMNLATFEKEKSNKHIPTKW